MALDPRIPLQARGPDIGGAISQGLQGARNLQLLQQTARQGPLRNQLLESQAESAQQQVAKQREQARLTSVITGAAELGPALATGNIDTVKKPIV